MIKPDTQVHSPAPHKVLGSVFLLMLKVIPVSVHLLLEEVECLSAKSLANQLYPKLMAPVKLHEKPEIIWLTYYIKQWPDCFIYLKAHR